MAVALRDIAAACSLRSEGQTVLYYGKFVGHFGSRKVRRVPLSANIQAAWQPSNTILAASFSCNQVRKPIPRLSPAATIEKLMYGFSAPQGYVQFTTDCAVTGYDSVVALLGGTRVEEAAKAVRRTARQGERPEGIVARITTVPNAAITKVPR